MDNNKFEKRINTIKNISIVCLVVSMFITVAVWASSYVGVSGNTIKFGKVDVEVGYMEGGNKKYFSETDKKMFDIDSLTTSTVKKEFFIENKGTLAAYYSIFFDNIEGNFGENLTVTITKADGTILLGGDTDLIKADEFLEDPYKAQKLGEIAAGERIDLVLILKYKYSNTITEVNDINKKFKFDFCVEATQKRNNPLS